MRRFSILGSVLGFGLLIHLRVVDDLLGQGLGDFLRRQSEAYAMIVLIGGFWAVFAPDGHPSIKADATHPISTSLRGYYGWFAALVAATVVVSSVTSLPQSVVTLKEAFAAAIIVCWYLGWSRSFTPHDRFWARGAPTVPAKARASYYVVAAVIVTTSSAVRGIGSAGASYADFIQGHAEALAAVILVPFAFDVVARSGRRLVFGAWLAFLTGVPLLVQLGRWPGFLDPMAGWTARVTEALLAALAISLWFAFAERPPRGADDSVDLTDQTNERIDPVTR